MPRLPKAESEKYNAGLAEWTPKVLATIQELAETSDNKVKRSEILANLGDDFEDRFVIPIFTALLAEGKIAKTGASRGRGARWGMPDVPSAAVEPETPEVGAILEDSDVVQPEPAAFRAGLLMAPVAPVNLTTVEIDTAIKALTKQTRADLRKAVKNADDAACRVHLSETLGILISTDAQYSKVKKRLLR